MTPTEKLLAALAERDCNPTPNAAGWSARCPAHDDRRPSLSISEGDDGRALLDCKAGCATENVVDAIGLRMPDLFRDAQPIQRQPKPQHQNDKPARKKYSTAGDAVAALARIIHEGLRIEKRCVREPLM